MPHNRKGRSELLDSIALLVLDAQDSFINTLYNKESFMQRSAFIIEAARSLRMRTIFTEQVPEKLGSTNKQLLALARKPKVFRKTSFSALNAPGIEQYLRDREIYHLIVCGLETPICIYQTGLQAVEEDIDITFLTDALGCRRKEDEQPVLGALKELGCHLLPSEAVFYSLLGDVGNHYFRAYNQLVKLYSESPVNLEERIIALKQIEDSQPQKKEKKQKRNKLESARKPQEGGNVAEEKSAETEKRPQSDESQKSGGRKRSRRRKPKSAKARENERIAAEAKDQSKADARVEKQSQERDSQETEPSKASTKKRTRKRVAKKAAKKVAKKATKKTARKAAASKKENPPKEVATG